MKEYEKISGSGVCRDSLEELSAREELSAENVGEADNVGTEPENADDLPVAEGPADSVPFDTETGLKSADEGEDPKEDITQDDPIAEDNKGAFYSSAKVFGVSEEQMESEFKSFKAGKLFERISLMLTDPFIPLAEFKNKLLAAVTMGFNSVTVLPNRLSVALKTVEGKLPVFVFVSYPYCVDDIKTRTFALKRVIRSSAEGVEMPINVVDLSERKLRSVIAEYKKYRKTARKKQFVLVIDVEKTSPTELGMIAAILKGAGIKFVKTSAAVGESRVDEYVLNNLKSSLGDGVKVIACSSSDEGKDVIGIFSCGADKFSSPNAIEIAKSIKDNLE